MIFFTIKFGSEYLFKEFHWDDGPPFGTAKPLELLTILPKEIEIQESNPTVCQKCGVKVKWEKDTDSAMFGTWYHLAEVDCDKPDPVSYTYQPLFDFLKSYDTEIAKSLTDEWDTI